MEQIKILFLFTVLILSMQVLAPNIAENPFHEAKSNFWVVISYLKSVAANFMKQAAIDPQSGLSNNILCILSAQVVVNLADYLHFNTLIFLWFDLWEIGSPLSLKDTYLHIHFCKFWTRSNSTMLCKKLVLSAFKVLCMGKHYSAGQMRRDASK